MLKKTFFSLTTLCTTMLFAEHYYSNGKKQQLTPISSQQKKSKSTTDNQKTYLSETGEVLKTKDTIIVEVSSKEIQQNLEKNHPLTYIKSFSSHMHLYRVKDQQDILEIANTLSSIPGVNFAHPNFIITKKSQALTSDPHSDLQWHLRDDFHGNDADINIEPAWQITKGEGVKVAVYDEGIDITHPDLAQNIYAYANYDTNLTNIPYLDDDSGHGTACAGILAASNNDLGGVGVAPNASLYAVRYSDTDVASDIEAFLWLMRQGVGVISNSWNTGVQLDAYNAIFKKLSNEGRDGKGTIILFAAGNKAQNLDTDGVNDESESPYVLSIAASSELNGIAPYSNYGSSIDFTAPGGSTDINGGGLFTTDAVGTAGYNNSAYNYNFMGTSAAAPVAAGVVTLMLSANEYLSKDDVITILKYTAQKLGTYNYDAEGRNDHWGYGKIDAGKAVTLAKTYGISSQKNFAQTMFQEQFYK